jgi:toxin-antitoxin system PIN domain toxin
MILVDANLLLYAYSQRYPEHDVAREWLEGVLNGPGRVGFPWGSTLAFARLAANRRLFPNAPSPDLAWAQVERWLSSPVAWVPDPTPEHAAVVGRLLATPHLTHNDLPDVHLAAIAIGHGLELQSHDAGFGRFDGLRWSDPLA